ncbi:hypothetical protein AURDEDRAFT_178016 [Auricularia subglabra TFB-10046 SS5]|uniref:Uncharacterized protein n=1 Tax=Auricularia subglabra (strain TFB-10046 / SS5) TaxID=717982 RepID=J0WKQ8_AURST|nr:hypothetical protein AURDEDRAFT_178016 [Auricularia subglabra TFB-10046 SS5]
MPDLKSIVARFYAVEAHRSRPVRVLVRGAFVAAEEHLGGRTEGAVRKCSVLVHHPDGRAYRFAIYYTVDSGEQNRAVNVALQRNTQGEYLVVAVRVSGDEMRYSDLRSANLADEALDELLDALDQRGDGQAYPEVLG